MVDEDAELLACRQLAHKTAFVLGYARSNTTIALHIINSAQNARLLGEANFYLSAHNPPRFRDWYNSMHVLFDNQVSKPTYAPDFIPGINHRYYDWLLAASDHYDLIGDKMAFSSLHFGYCAPNDIMAFYEARFFASRYVFTLREPVQNLLSCLKLIGKDDAVSLRTLMVAWLDFIKFWADWIRTFPHTLTLAGALDKQKVQQLLGFLSLESPDAWLLLDDEERRLHLDAGRYEDLALHADALSDIYQHALAAIADDTVLWGAAQKRTFEMNDTRGSVTSRTVTKPRHLGQAWAKAEALKATLASEALVDAIDA